MFIMRKNLSIIISVILLVITMVICSGFSIKQDSALSEQKSQINDLQNTLEMASTKRNTIRAQNMMQATGLDLDRKAFDDRTAEDFLKFVFTWNSLSDYNRIRDSLEDDYNMDPAGDFMSKLMPSLSQYDSTGLRYGTAASGFNMTYESMESYVINISTSSYSYFTLVTVSSISQTGHEGVGLMALTYDVDVDHNISNIRGYVVE